MLIGTAEWGGLGGLSALKLPNDDNIIVTVHYYNPFPFTHQGASWVGAEANAWLGTKWNDSDIEREVVQNEFGPLVRFEKNNNVPIHIGEFGAFSTADEKSRSKWTTFMARYIESLGWSWAYWEFSAGFGIYNPSKGTWNMYLVDALLHNPLPEPARYVGTPIYTSNFKTSTDGWTLQTNTGTAILSRADNTLKTAITSGGTESWHIQLMKGSIKLTAGKKYKFSFKGKAETPRSATAYIGMSVAPWSSYSGYSSISLTDTFFVYNFIIDMKTTDNTARMVFDLGKSASVVFVTDVKLEEIVLEWPTSAPAVETVKTAIFPNPATDQITISNLDGFKSYTLVNMQGMAVKSGILHDYSNSVSIEEFAPGLYFIHLTGDNRKYSAKILKQ